MSVCVMCGETVDEHNLRHGCIFCSTHKGYVCFNCSNACEQHTKYLLPNGTNCREKWKDESVEKRILGRRWIVAPERVEAELGRYEDIPPDELREKYIEAVEYFDNARERAEQHGLPIPADKLILMKARLAAMQQLLYSYDKKASQADLQNKIKPRNCVKHYRKVYKSPPNARIKEQIADFLEKGISQELIFQAIDRAADKDKRWNYVKGILEVCIREGKQTLERSEASSFDITAFEQKIQEQY